MRTYTAIHWLGSDVLRETFEAESDGAALEAFEEMGWNAYDDHLILTEAGEWVSMVDTCSELDW